MRSRDPRLIDAQALHVAALLTPGHHNDDTHLEFAGDGRDQRAGETRSRFVAANLAPDQDSIGARYGNVGGALRPTSRAAIPDELASGDGGAR